MHQESAPLPTPEDVAAVQTGGERWKPGPLARAATAVALMSTLPGIGSGAEASPQQIIPVVTEEAPATESDAVSVVDGHVTMDYEGDYQTEESDAWSALAGADEFVQAHADIFEHPENITFIQINGTTSAENSNAPNEWTDQSEANHELGEDRSDLGESALGAIGDSRLGVDLSSKIRVGEPREQRFTPEERVELDEMAQGHGYADLTALRDSVRAGEDAPQEAVDFVNSLDDQRGYDVRVGYRDGTGKIKFATGFMRTGSGDQQKTVVTDGDVQGYIADDGESVVTEAVTGLPVDDRRGRLTKIGGAAPRLPQDKLYRDRQNQKGDWKQIRGQKPIRNRGRTHMVGPQGG